MKQFNITFLLIMLMSMVGAKISAYDFEVDGICYKVLSLEDLTCEIAPRYSKSSNYSGYFTIPNEVQYQGRTFKVIQIGEYAFAESSVNSVTVPEGIKTIGEEAFSECGRIVSMQIPSTVTSIGSRSFFSCKSLVSITLPKSMTSIGDWAFTYCTSLSQITIPDGISSIQGSTFRGCTSLVDVSISQSVKSIGESAFENCSALVSIDLPNSLESIGESAFKSCSTLKEFKVPSSCNEIRNYAFNDCKNLKKLIIEDNTTPLLLGFSYLRNDYAKQYSDLFTSNNNFSLDTLYLGRIAKRGLKWLTNGGRDFRIVADYGIFGSNLRSITIGNMVTDEIYNSDERYLFSKIKSHHITIGNGITTIPDLSYNEYLDSIVVLNEIPPSAVGFANKTYLDCRLYVPKGCKAAYESADVWKNFWNVIELEQDFNTLDIKTYNETSGEIEVSRYSVDGKRINAPQKGINIIKLSDGTVKKVVVK